MSGKFVLKKSAANGQFFFHLSAANGQTILKSEMYTTKAAAENGIKSVKTNAPLDERYERKTAKNGEPASRGVTNANSSTLGSRIARTPLPACAWPALTLSTDTTRSNIAIWISMAAPAYSCATSAVMAPKSAPAAAPEASRYRVMRSASARSAGA